jgi:rubrerythrin
MTTEQDKTLQALQMAIQMENDGQKYYLLMSQRSSHSIGKKLMATLAAEEEQHRHRFEEIYDALRNKKAWPVTGIFVNQEHTLKNIFNQAAEAAVNDATQLDTELDAVKTALEMENKSYDLYKKQEASATYPAERDFYQNIASEEWQHHLVLLDYYEYLKDPSSWFTSKEHPSLDGG